METEFSHKNPSSLLVLSHLNTFYTYAPFLTSMSCCLPIYVCVFPVTSLFYIFQLKWPLHFSCLLRFLPLSSSLNLLIFGEWHRLWRFWRFSRFGMWHCVCLVKKFLTFRTCALPSYSGYMYFKIIAQTMKMEADISETPASVSSRHGNRLHKNGILISTTVRVSNIAYEPSCVLRLPSCSFTSGKLCLFVSVLMSVVRRIRRIAKSNY
jgi:hypothetical protein